MGGVSLPYEEANLFKLIVKSYETKQYKKGLKAADAILKKFPDHGETLSMKGLTLNCMNRKSEAYELVRLGLKNDLRSHVCWHVYGLLYRSDREYREAIKCYRNALRIDPDNIEILRDLALLQAQMRDFEGFVETRQQLLMLKPNDRMNWIGFAVSQHLNFNGLKAVDILEAYERTLEDDYPPDNEPFEDGEMLLYKISLLEECGLIERALEELRKKEFKIVDKLSYKEQEVTLLEKLGLFGDGEELYRKLLSMNPDNYRYYEGLQRCMGLYSAHGQYSSDDIDRLEALYASLSKLYSSSFAVKRIPLGFLNAEKFRLAAKNYILPFLTKGVSSLFSDLSSLYDDSAKAVILEQLILELEHSVKTTGGYPGRSEKEPPSTLMWILFYLAQHYDRLGQYDVSLRKIDEAIEHTPTLIDLYLVKSRILKHAGDSVAAAALADEARCMDLADHYVNSECVKRMLQADQVTLAEKTAVLFRKDGEQHNNLHDMQCMWYELAFGESYLRRGELGQALKKFLAVEKHYADITEDQFDFHSYCLRKMTLRTYVEMLKFQDRLHSYSYFRKAAAGAVKCYLKLYDSPPKSSAEEDEEMSKLPPSQKKKLRQKQRKAETRAKKEAEMKEESNATIVSKSGKRQVKPVDPDPHGEKLLEVEDPLAEATKYLKLLQKHSSDSLETHLLSFEVNMRKQKTLLALKAVKHLLRLDADNPDTHRCLIKFFHKVGSLHAPVSDAEKVIWGVLEAERPTFSQLQGNSLIEENSLFLEKHGVTEDETRVVLSQRTPVTTVTTGDFVAEFKSSLKLVEIEDDTSTVLAQKKEAPKEESADNSSPLKSTASGAGLGTPSTSKSSKGEGHSTGVVSKTTDGAPLNKGKTENEVKHVEDEPTLNSKSNPPTKSASPPASSKSGSASPSGPITEEETRVLLQRTPVTTGDLVAEFKSRLKLEEIEDDISPLIAPKKEAPKEERVDNSSPLKSTASGAGRGTPSTSKSLNRKRKRNNEESTGTDGAPLEKAKTQNEVKSVKDEPTSSTKSNAPTKCASPPASSKSGSAPLSGPVTEDEIRALLQGKPMTLWDFALKFYRRVTTERDKDAFGAILRRITRIQKTGASYKEDLVFLREIEDDMSPVVAPKEEVPKEEPVDNSSSLESSASGAGGGTPSTSRSSKGKSIKNGKESKTTNGPPLNKVKTENKIQEVKSVKDEPTSSTKCNAPTRSASPPASSKSGSAPSAGPISEDEIRVLLQGTPKTVRDLVLPFESRLKTRRDQEAFMDLVIRITGKWKTGGADSKYVLFLREDR